MFCICKPALTKHTKKAVGITARAGSLDVTTRCQRSSPVTVFVPSTTIGHQLSVSDPLSAFLGKHHSHHPHHPPQNTTPSKPSTNTNTIHLHRPPAICLRPLVCLFGLLRISLCDHYFLDSDAPRSLCTVLARSGWQTCFSMQVWSLRNGKLFHRYSICLFTPHGILSSAKSLFCLPCKVQYL